MMTNRKQYLRYSPAHQVEIPENLLEWRLNWSGCDLPRVEFWMAGVKFTRVVLRSGEPGERMCAEERGRRNSDHPHA